MRPTVENPGRRPLPDGVVDAFWRYEEALMADDIPTMESAFVATEAALRTDASGTRVGHAEIARFRRDRGGAPLRSVRRLVVVEVAPEVVVTAATTADRHGGQGVITQVWRHDEGEWRIAAAHVDASAGERT